jgi:hypothetical protein
MRSIGGLDRPGVQWLFVLLAVVLIAVSATEAVALRRARAALESSHARELETRLRQQELEIRLSHEEVAREAFSLEASRLRSSGTAAPSSQPTLTLAPITKRGAQPPDPTVAQPQAAQPIQLRLVLPPGRPTPASPYAVAIRTWSGGETIWQRSGLAASTVEGKSMVTALVTGDVFAPGAYEIALSAGPSHSEIASFEVGVHASSR